MNCNNTKQKNVYHSHPTQIQKTKHSTINKLIYTNKKINIFDINIKYLQIHLPQKHHHHHRQTLQIVHIHYFVDDL